jgi:hypothetical protein
VTEQEWLECARPLEMLEFLRASGKGSDRKLRLFACACCRRAWRFFTSKRLQAAVEVSERYADGLATTAELEQAQRAAQRLADRGFRRKVRAMPWAMSVQGKFAKQAATQVASADMDEVVDSVRGGFVVARSGADYERQVRREQLRQCDLLRDLFHPFHCVPCQRAWLTWNDATVKRVAETAYQDRSLPAGRLDQSRLAILADALEEAGCADIEILNHLRSPGPHTRGCFVLDLLLGKS